MSKMNLNELRDKAYKTACEHGFHDQELSNNHFLCLVISELMEAVEADRKGRRANVDRYNKKIANSRICQGLDSDIPKERGYEVAYNETIKGSIEEELADACNQYHVKLVYASSSTANPENTTSLYGISKYFDEQYASIYCKAATGCRLHNVYGPNPRKRTLLWFLMEKENVSLYNCGQNIRCFTYIDDVIEGLIYSVGCNRQLINICNVQPVTTMYFASLVKYYKPIEIELINKKRDFDNLEQSVNRDIYLVPLSYTSVEDGVKKIFDERKGKDMSY